MLLAIDVGNTNFTMGLFREEELVAKFRMTTKLPRTSDEYGIAIRELIRNQGEDPDQVDDIIVASVVPDIMHSLGSCIIKYFDRKPIIVSAGIKTGIRVATENPRQTGADRIVDAVAAYYLYGGPVIVVDFGTATTYDIITPNGEFIGCVISPGIRTSANALWQHAAKLPEIEIRKPDSILTGETVTGMQAGLVYGYIGQTEYIIRKIIEESGYEDVKVVATGGLGKMIAEETDCIDYYDANLTLKGLQIIYDKQKR